MCANTGNALINLTDTTVSLVDVKETTKDPMTMQIITERNEDGTELTMSLKLIGNGAAAANQPLLLYAQVENPERPGEFESFTCTVVLDQANYFVQERNLHIMNYEGRASLKDQTSGNGDVKFDKINEADQMGLGRPWNSVMPSSGEDEEEEYKTFWEYTTKKFKTQLCTVRRAIGTSDIGRFKLKENVDYNVHVGAKVFYSKLSSRLSRAADAAQPVKLNMEFGWSASGTP